MRPSVSTTVQITVHQPPFKARSYVDAGLPLTAKRIWVSIEYIKFFFPNLLPAYYILNAPQ